MVPIDLTRTLLLNLDNDYVVLLRSAEDKRALPISIGQFEAQAIAIKLNDVDVPRPLTHDLLKSVLDAANCEVERVEVCDLRDDTFFAKLHLQLQGQSIVLDSRPSDAIAVALRSSAPVYVDDKIMQQAGVIFSEETAETGPIPTDAERTEETSPQTPPTPAQVLQRKLEQAVAQERYEEAARIRDQIRKLGTSN